MPLKYWIPGIALLAASASALAQANRNGPRVGYLFPAGACRGTTLEVIAGGRGLRAVKAVRVSGKGVAARVIGSYRPPRNMNGDQRKIFAWHVACRRRELNGAPKPPKPDELKKDKDGKLPPGVKIPDHPLLDMLDRLDLGELEHWTTYFQRFDRMQPSPQIAEMVRLEIKVAPDAAPGMREIRFSGPMGFTNPMRFEVSALPEIREAEPNEPGVEPLSGSAKPVRLPCTLNGQIQAGDVDVFRFKARRGQKVVVIGGARSLIPYLADAVPGWFQMVLAVKDPEGRELAYGDSYRFDPDPVLFCKIPADGEYTLEVRDSIYRGREDFVYRIAIGELPFVTSRFPLGGRGGEPLAATVRGWNLPGARLRLDTSPGGPPLRKARMPGKPAPSNEVSYAVGDLPETGETEPNNDFQSAAPVPVPCVVNGVIGKSGDCDVYRIDGRKGADLVVEVAARSLKSPLDSVVHVADESGTVLGWNDDAMEKEGHLHLGDGLLTHHADSRLRVRIPADGPLFIRIADTQLGGGPDHAYRLRIAAPSPSFELRVSPSAIHLGGGSNAPVQVHVLRHDGYQGEIRLSLKDAPPGCSLSGARIPAGARQCRITLTADPLARPGVFTPQLVGTATHNGQTVSRPALAADNTMQAFLWRHLVESREWLVSTGGKRSRRSPVTLKGPLPVKIPVGGSATVRVNAPKWLVERGVRLEPDDAPEGIRYSETRAIEGGFAFDIHAGATGLKAGFETNLIIDLIAGTPDGKKPAPANRKINAFNTLPALPITLVQPATP